MNAACRILLVAASLPFSVGCAVPLIMTSDPAILRLSEERTRKEIPIALVIPAYGSTSSSPEGSQTQASRVQPYLAKPFAYRAGNVYTPVTPVKWIIWIPGRGGGFAGEEFRGVLIVPPGYEPEYHVLRYRLSRDIPLFMEPPRPPQDVLLSFRPARDPVAVLESLRQVLVDGGEVQIGGESSPIRGDGSVALRVRLDWLEQRQVRAWFDEQIEACHRDRR